MITHVFWACFLDYVLYQCSDLDSPQNPAMVHEYQKDACEYFHYYHELPHFKGKFVVITMLLYITREFRESFKVI